MRVGGSHRGWRTWVSPPPSKGGRQKLHIGDGVRGRRRRPVERKRINKDQLEGNTILTQEEIESGGRKLCGWAWEVVRK